MILPSGVPCVLVIVPVLNGCHADRKDLCSVLGELSSEEVVHHVDLEHDVSEHC